MPEDIKARIIFDMKGAAGGVGGKVSQPGIGLGKLTAGVALGNIVHKGILKGVNSLVAASPRLQAMIKVFNKGLMLILRPIGNVIANWVKPFVMQFLRFGMKFYKDYQSGGFWYAFKEALGTIDWAAAAQTALAAILTITIAKMGLGALAAALGVGVVGTSLLVPLALALAGITLGKALGLTGLESILIGVMGLGAYIIGGAVAGAGGALIAIPVMLALAGTMWGARKAKEKSFKESILSQIGLGAFTLSGTEFGNIIGIPIVISIVGLIWKDKDKDRKKFTSEGITGIFPELKAPWMPDEVGLLKQSKFEVAETKKEYKGLFDWITKIWTKGESPAILDYPTLFAQGFLKELPIIKDTFTDMFKTGLIKNALEPSILKTRQLFDELMRLNTTVVTTHIIRTRVVED